MFWDYGYLCSKSEGACSAEEEAALDAKGSSPILVAWDATVKRYWCWVLPSKGVDFEGLENVLRVIVDDLRHTGYRKVNFGRMGNLR